MSLDPSSCGSDTSSPQLLSSAASSSVLVWAACHFLFLRCWVGVGVLGGETVGGAGGAGGGGGGAGIPGDLGGGAG